MMKSAALPAPLHAPTLASMTAFGRTIRPGVMLCLLVTLLLAWQATRIGINASYEKTIPTGHPYVANFLENRSELSGLGNSLRIAVEVKQGSIFTKEYLDTLVRLNDELYLLPGVDRPYMKSLWTPTTRWTAVTEERMLAEHAAELVAL